MTNGADAAIITTAASVAARAVISAQHLSSVRRECRPKVVPLAVRCGAAARTHVITRVDEFIYATQSVKVGSAIEKVCGVLGRTGTGMRIGVDWYS